jgi:acyl-CoA thioesterase
MFALVPITALLERRQRDGDVVRYRITEDWKQGRTTFGGLVAALAVAAMRDVTGSDWPLRALQASFIGPVDEDLEVSVKLLRQGRHVRQVQATLSTHGQAAAVLLGVFGESRASSLQPLIAEAPPVAIAPDAARQLPFMEGVAPNFIAHVDPRWAEGDLPYSNGEHWHSRIHVRLRDAAPDAELTSVLLADMPPSPAVGRLKQRVPASSVSWEIELIPARTPYDPMGWWRADTEVIAASDGYVNQRTSLRAPDGTLAALGYQVAAVYG